MVTRIAFGSIIVKIRSFGDFPGERGCLNKLSYSTRVQI